jgi:hypothetical protein
MTISRDSSEWRNLRHKCKYCNKPGVPLVAISLLVFEVDRKTLLKDNKNWLGCQECLDSLDSFVKWSEKTYNRRVGVYCHTTNPSKKAITQ